MLQKYVYLEVESYSTYSDSDACYSLEKILRFLGSRRRYTVETDSCMFETESVFHPHMSQCTFPKFPKQPTLRQLKGGKI